MARLRAGLFWRARLVLQDDRAHHRAARLQRVEHLGVVAGAELGQLERDQDDGHAIVLALAEPLHTSTMASRSVAPESGWAKMRSPRLGFAASVV